MPVQCLEKFQVQCFFKEYCFQIFRDTLHWPPFFWRVASPARFFLSKKMRGDAELPPVGNVRLENNKQRFQFGKFGLRTELSVYN
jgi:hypothetical protein